MKRLYLFLIVSLVLAIGAIYLASHKIDGWGWFLFGSIITFVYPSKNENTSKDNGDND